MKKLVFLGVLALFAVGAFAQTISTAFYNDRNDSIYFINGKGNKYTSYILDKKKWRDVASWTEFGEGKNPFPKMSCAFYNQKSDFLVVFSEDGKKYVSWDGEKKVWTDVRDTGDIFNGKGPFKAVGACFYNSNNDKVYLFSKDGTKYTAWDADKKDWRTVEKVSEYADGNGPIKAVGAAFYHSKNDQVYFFDTDMKTYTAWDAGEKSWRDVAPVSKFGNGGMPDM